MTTEGDSFGTVAVPVSEALSSPPQPATSAMTRTALAARERIPAGIFGIGAQLLFDPKELVVLRHAVGPAGGARLDLAGVGRDGEVGDRRVLRLPRPVRDDGRVARRAGERDRLERLRQRPDLVHLDQDRICDP